LGRGIACQRTSKQRQQTPVDKNPTRVVWSNNRTNKTTIVQGKAKLNTATSSLSPPALRVLGRLGARGGNGPKSGRGRPSTPSGAAKSPTDDDKRALFWFAWGLLFVQVLWLVSCRAHDEALKLQYATWVKLGKAGAAGKSWGGRPRLASRCCVVVLLLFFTRSSHVLLAC